MGLRNIVFALFKGESVRNLDVHWYMNGGRRIIQLTDWRRVWRDIIIRLKKLFVKMWDILLRSNMRITWKWRD